MVEPNGVRANQFSDSLQQGGWSVERALSIQDALRRIHEVCREKIEAVVICPFVFEENTQMSSDQRKESRHDMASLLQHSGRISLLCDQQWETGACPPVCHRCPIRN